MLWWSPSKYSPQSIERAADALEAGLLPELADGGLDQRLAVLDPAAGHAPAPRRRRPAAPHEEEAVVVDDHGADARRPGSRQRAVHDDGARHQAERLEEVLGVAIAGEGEAVDAEAALLAAPSISASIITSPTPSSRAPGSV